MAIKMICACNEQQYIGLDGDLLYKISADLKRFKKLTTNSIIVMGRKTFESLPKMLPDRLHVILTTDKNYKTPSGAIVVNSIEQIVNNYLQTGHQDRDIFIIGGEVIYDAFIGYADMVHLTRVLDDKKGDAEFPLWQLEDEFRCMNMELHIENGIEFAFEDWVNPSYVEEYYKSKGEC